MIAMIILAAGQSRRMGNVNKLTCDLGGKRVVDHVIDAARASKAAPIILVYSSPDVAAPRSGVDLVKATDAHKGQSHSLRAGVSAISGMPNVKGALVGLGDMPFITSSHINAVYAQAIAQPDKIMRPYSGAAPGHPVFWPRSYFSALMELTGDGGARALLRSVQNETACIDLGDDAVTFDVDTPERLERARNKLGGFGNPSL